MPTYKCPKCGRKVELPVGRYYCKVCGPSAFMVVAPKGNPDNAAELQPRVVSENAVRFREYQKQRLREMGAVAFFKALREGEYFYHVSLYSNIKKILQEGTIKPDRHGRGTVSFTTNPLRYLSAYGNILLPVNNAYLKIPMSLVPEARPAVYWLDKVQLEEVSPELRSLIIPFERVDELLIEYGYGFPLYIYPAIWSYENEWRMIGAFPIPYEHTEVGVSNERQRRELERLFGGIVKNIFVDQDYAKIYARRR
jgi:DNA-directed RNA polymerase subunit RPC12/RpoP